MSVPTNIRGDCNNNGSVDGLDVVYLQRLLLEDPNNPMVLAHEQQYDLDNNGQINGLDVVYLQRMLLSDPNNPQIPINTEPPVLNLIYRNENNLRETMTIQPGAGFPDNHYLQTGHLVMNDKGEGVTRDHYKFYPTALPSNTSAWGAAGDDTPFNDSVNIHPTLAGTDAASNPIPSLAGDTNFNDQTPTGNIYQNWDIWNKYNSLAEQKMFTDVDLLPNDSEVNIINPESNKIHFCVTSYLMETADVFVDTTDTTNDDPSNLKASRFAVGDAKAFARTAFKLDNARPYTVFSRELGENDSPIPLNDANVDHEITVITVNDADPYNIGMAGDDVSYKIQPGEGEGRLQIIQDIDFTQTQSYTHSSSFAFAGEKKIYRVDTRGFIDFTATLSLCNPRTNVEVNVNVKVVGDQGDGFNFINSDSCADDHFIQNISFVHNAVYEIEITTVDPTQTGDYTMTLIGTADNIPETNTAFNETQLFTLDASQTWTDDMRSEVNDGLHKWDSIITATPTGTKISPTFSLQSLGTTNDNHSFSKSLVHLTNTEAIPDTTGHYANFQITKGAVILDSNKYSSDWSNNDNNNTHSVTDYSIIGLGHVLGIGTLWNINATINDNPVVKPELINMGVNDEGFSVINADPKKVYLYTGNDALQVYKYVPETLGSPDTLKIDTIDTNFKNSISVQESINKINAWVGIPIEHDSDVQVMTDNLKLEEGDSTGGTKILIDDGVSASSEYLGLAKEYMTSHNDHPIVDRKLSAISAAFLKDLGYSVDFSKCDAFNMRFEADSF